MITLEIQKRNQQRLRWCYNLYLMVEPVAFKFVEVILYVKKKIFEKSYGFNSLDAQETNV